MRRFLKILSSLIFKDPGAKLGYAIATNLVFIGLVSIYIDKFIRSCFIPSGTPLTELIWLLSYAALLILSMAWTNYERKRFSTIEIPHEHECEEGYYRALIIALSTNNKNIEDITIKDNDEERTLYIKIKEETDEKKYEIKRDISIPSLKDRLEEFYSNNNGLNWVMPLRSIFKSIKREGKYKKGLEQLWIVSSVDNKTQGSYSQIKNFIKLIDFFFTGRFDIYVYDKKAPDGNLDKYLIDNNYISYIIKGETAVNQGVSTDDKLGISAMNERSINYDNFTNIYQFYDDIIKEITKDKRIKDNEIGIDITSGTKIIGAAGAVATLKYKTRIIYVDTNAPDKITEIDAGIAPPPNN